MRVDKHAIGQALRNAIHDHEKTCERDGRNPEDMSYYQMWKMTLRAIESNEEVTITGRNIDPIESSQREPEGKKWMRREDALVVIWEHSPDCVGRTEAENIYDALADAGFIRETTGDFKEWWKNRQCLCDAMNLCYNPEDGDDDGETD